MGQAANPLPDRILDRDRGAAGRPKIDLQDGRMQPGNSRGWNFAGGEYHPYGAVSAHLLGALQATISEGEHFFVAYGARIREIPGKGRPSDRTSAIDALARGTKCERFVANRQQDAFGKKFGFFAIGVARDDQKFLPSPPDQDIGVADRGTDAARHLD